MLISSFSSGKYSPRPFFYYPESSSITQRVVCSLRRRRQPLLNRVGVTAQHQLGLVPLAVSRISRGRLSISVRKIGFQIDRRFKAARRRLELSLLKLRDRKSTRLNSSHLG